MGDYTEAEQDAYQDRILDAITGPIQAVKPTTATECALMSETMLSLVIIYGFAARGHASFTKEVFTAAVAGARKAISEACSELDIRN